MLYNTASYLVYIPHAKLQPVWLVWLWRSWPRPQTESWHTSSRIRLSSSIQTRTGRRWCRHVSPARSLARTHWPTCRLCCFRCRPFVLLLQMIQKLLLRTGTYWLSVRRGFSTCLQHCIRRWMRSCIEIGDKNGWRDYYPIPSLRHILFKGNIAPLWKDFIL